MGGSAEIVRTLEGGLARGVLGVYKGGGWVKNDQKRAYVICTQSLSDPTCYRNSGANSTAITNLTELEIGGDTSTIIHKFSEQPNAVPLPLTKLSLKVRSFLVRKLKEM